jgi:hypothetical protein
MAEMIERQVTWDRPVGALVHQSMDESVVWDSILVPSDLAVSVAVFSTGPPPAAIVSDINTRADSLDNSLWHVHVNQYVGA